MYRSSLPDFIAWLEPQDPNKTYDWMGDCVIFQYLAERQIPHQGVDGKYMAIEYPGGDRGGPGIAHSLPHTIGACLQRAKEAQEALICAM